MNRRYWDIIFPYRCPGCGSLIPREELVCSSCADRFRHLKPPFCMRCGRHIEDGERELCSQCASRQHRYTAGMSVFAYDPFMRASMSDFKFNGRTDNADYYVREAAAACRDRITAFAPDALVPIPIHRTRRNLRGYNQTELLADGIGSLLGIRVVKDLLVRRRRTGFQKELDAEKRRANLERAFECNGFIYGRQDIEKHFAKILLIDDIYTTGSTMDACAGALLRGGVRSVGILSICMGQGY